MWHSCLELGRREGGGVAAPTFTRSAGSPGSVLTRRLKCLRGGRGQDRPIAPGHGGITSGHWMPAKFWGLEAWGRCPPTAFSFESHGRTVLFAFPERISGTRHFIPAGAQIFGPDHQPRLHPQLHHFSRRVRPPEVTNRKSLLPQGRASKMAAPSSR